LSSSRIIITRITNGTVRASLKNKNLCMKHYSEPFQSCSDLLKTDFNIFFLSPKPSLPLWFTDQNFVCISSHFLHAYEISPFLIVLDLTTLTEITNYEVTVAKRILLRSICILYFHLLLCLPSGPFSWRFPTQILYVIISFSCACYIPRPLHFSSFNRSNNINSSSSFSFFLMPFLRLRIFLFYLWIP
jgi:hypothetical protein